LQISGFEDLITIRAESATRDVAAYPRTTIQLITPHHMTVLTPSFTETRIQTELG
jgi:hypothetical protein